MTEDWPLAEFPETLPLAQSLRANPGALSSTPATLGPRLPSIAWVRAAEPATQCRTSAGQTGTLAGLGNDRRPRKVNLDLQGHENLWSDTKYKKAELILGLRPAGETAKK